MRKTILSLILLLSAFIFLVGSANASTVNFGDSTIYWPGQGNGTQQDNEDVIGIPNILGGSYTITGSVLQSITFKYTSNITENWSYLVPGDLFIDTNADGKWDYVAANMDGTSPGTWDLYGISVDVGSKTDYIISNQTGEGVLRGGSGWPSGLTVRNNHPVALDSNLLVNKVGSVDFSGWENLTHAGQILESTFTFNDGGLDVSSDWIFGWTVNCGNDVIYEHGTSEAPIPGAVWLLGSGLLGLIGVRRRSRK